jgi:hypothetical protein
VGGAPGALFCGEAGEKERRRKSGGVDAALGGMRAVFECARAMCRD